MPGEVRCPSCDRALCVPGQVVGGPVECPGCLTAFRAGAGRPRIAPSGGEEDEDYPYYPPRMDAHGLVARPAVALMVVGGLTIALSVLMLTGNLLRLAVDPPRGWTGPSGLIDVAVGVGMSAYHFFCGGLIVAGAVRLKKLQNFRLAMTASIVAMTPFNACFVLGLPFGIWALVVLNKPEVKGSFT